MKKFVISLLSVIFLCAAATAQVLVGMTDTTAYFPQLEGRRVAVSRIVDATRAYPIHVTTESGGALGWMKKARLQVVSST